MSALTTEDVLERAERWARLHRKPETRSKMDECLTGLSEFDQRRVYLCGQRIAAGMSPKVIPAPSEPKQKGDKNGKQASHPVKGRKSGTAGSPATGDPQDKGGKSVGTSARPKRQSKKGRDSEHPFK